LGKVINDVKVHIEEKLSSLCPKYSRKEELERLKEEQIDISLPGRRPTLAQAPYNSSS